MAKKSRVPDSVGSIPLVGDLVKQADSQAQWVQDLVGQNTRMIGQLPEMMKTFNTSLERFNQTVGRLDRMVTQVEKTTTVLLGPMEELLGPMEEIAPRLERLVTMLDIPSVWELPAVVDALRKEALPALRATTDVQKQVALLQATIERVLTLMSELPGMNLMRRLAAGLSGAGVDVPPDAAEPSSPSARTSSQRRAKEPSSPSARTSSQRRSTETPPPPSGSSD